MEDVISSINYGNLEMLKDGFEASGRESSGVASFLLDL